MGGTRFDPVKADDITVEGLAGQLYAHASSSGFAVLWHLLKRDLKDCYRAQARAQIVEYNRRNAPADKES